MHNDFLDAHRIYQDHDILVVNKPNHLLSVPGKGDALFDSLLSRLVAAEPKTLLIHRLDRDTSGILVFALNKAAQSHISKQFQARQTEKLYEAIVVGELTGSGLIDVPVRYDPSAPPLHIVDLDHPKAAQTHWKALELSDINHTRVSRVELQPITGRSHQLRVHMQHMNHAILGDELYAEEADLPLSPRLCLHARHLAFKHPSTQKMISFESQVPF